MKNKVITSFGSAFIKPDDIYYSQVEQCGKILASHGYIVCSGGYYGTMEAISKGAKSSGGRTIGITVKNWNSIVNKYIDEEIECEFLQDRLSLLISKADAYIVFRGGTGTLSEIALTLEMMNKGKMPKKNMYFYGDFWRSTIETLKSDSDKLFSLLEEVTYFFKTPFDLEAIL